MVDKTVERQSKKSQLLAFTKVLYAGAWKDDLANLDALDRKRIASEFLDFCQQRQHNKASVRVRSTIKVDEKKGGKITETKGFTSIEIVNDDMPFLVDSTINLINSLGYSVKLVFHPTLHLERESSGKLARILSSKGKKESLIYIQIDSISDSEQTKLIESIQSTMVQIRHAVRDWKRMTTKLDELIEGYRTKPPPIDDELITESILFLEWLKNNNFTFLGVAEYNYSFAKGGELKINRLNNGLGILCDPSVSVLGRHGQSLAITPEIQEFLAKPGTLIVTKANRVSQVHRQVHLDYIGIKQYSDQGDVIGEVRFVGLFTSTAYTRSVRSIPLIQQKVAQVINKSGFDPSGHSGKGLIDVLETYPRDDLFQIDVQSLYKNVLSILRLQERPAVRVILRRDKFDRFVSVLVYVHRERFNSRLRKEIGELLERVFIGHVSFFVPNYLPIALVRVHYIIGLDIDRSPRVSTNKLEREIDELSLTWDMRLLDAMRNCQLGSEPSLIQHYSQAFPSSYTAIFDISTALADIEVVRLLSDSSKVAVRFNEREGKTRLRVYSLTKPVPLSARVPILEHMGFSVINETTHNIRPQDSEQVYLHEMTLFSSNVATNIHKQAHSLEEVYLAVWQRLADSDNLNALVLLAGIHWRDIILLRAMTRYLLLIGMNYDLSFVAESLNRYPRIATHLIELFYIRLDPDIGDDKRGKSIKRVNQKIESSLAKVFSFDDDKIIRKIQNLINSILRTNFFQQDELGQRRPALVIKLNPAVIEELPMPIPFRETFIYSPVVEGTHLRFGKVARGGLRWSDRAQDYRTEVLGLVKAQQVKNAVIIPVGAKGCFVPRQLPAEREQMQQEAIRAYKIYISGLLDITDNIEGSTVVIPQRTVCHDDADPYLVVAADKGTASFSDIANNLATERGFWLGDAFASGGSTGYDHKKMGITAKGAWESVKRHFRELDRNIQEQPFTVVGVGDMSGDVFGNGMLLSKTTRLIAAFDHRDIFIDPNPDIVKSFAERNRLFKLSRSSWQDYNKKYISAGGGVFSRSEKSISLSKSTAELFGLRKTSIAPHELIKVILSVSVDLLWFGGIGTYIRSSNESNVEVGDKANDIVRITAKQLNCKVIGEGANLGMTQKARIEFNKLGGRCYSDAIDNSAGVNSSDLEVNLKIALGELVADKQMDLHQRNELLASQTNKVAKLCLANNYRQGLAISLCHQLGSHVTAELAQQMDILEQLGELDREVENLPSHAEMIERIQSDQPLSRAEIGVLLAYVKNVLQQEIIASDLPEDPSLVQILLEYFPTKIKESFSKQLSNHPLKREIIATALVNEMINLGGLTIVSRISQRTAANSERVTKAWVIANKVYKFTGLFTQIDLLDNKLSGQYQLDLYHRVQRFVDDRIFWFVQNLSLEEDIDEISIPFAKQITKFDSFINIVDDYTKAQMKQKLGNLIDKKLPHKLAETLASLPLLGALAPITRIAQESGVDTAKVASAYYQIDNLFNFTRFTDDINRYQQDYLDADNNYDMLASDEALTSIQQSHDNIVTALVSTKQPFNQALLSWQTDHQQQIVQSQTMLNDISKGATLSIAKIMLASSQLARLGNTALNTSDNTA